MIQVVRKKGGAVEDEEEGWDSFHFPGGRFRTTLASLLLPPSPLPSSPFLASGGALLDRMEFPRRATKRREIACLFCTGRELVAT